MTRQALGFSPIPRTTTPLNSPLSPEISPGGCAVKNQNKMQENQNNKEQTLSEILRQRTVANIKVAKAYRAWEATLSINTLGQSEQVVKRVCDKRSAALDEYNKCHAEAFRISEMFNSVYRDMAGTDDLLSNQHYH